MTAHAGHLLLLSLTLGLFVLTPHQVCSTSQDCSCCADARTYYSRLQVNHGMDFEEAKQYRDNYSQDRKDRGFAASDRNGMYLSSTIKDQGKTGTLASGKSALSSKPCVGATT